MKKLQLLAKTFFTVLALSAVLTFSSCKDECKDVTCNNGGTCVSGACDCATGFEGTNCETAWRTKFLRTGAGVTETCPGIGYNVDVVTGTATNEIRIKNLGNYNCPVDYYVVATVTSSTNVTIASQDVCSGALNFTGSGTISSGVISISYVATYDPGTGTNISDNCTATIN